MARIPMITRTVVTTVAKILCVNTTTEETEIKVVEIPRTYTDDKKLLNTAKEVLDPTIIPVKVISTEIKETLYGMTEQNFIELAEKLPPRTKTETDENAQD